MIAAGALLVAGAMLAWALWPASHPDPNGDPLVVARFVGTSEFFTLPEGRRMAYLQALRKNADKIDEALQRKQFSERSYDRAMAYVWLARQLDHMDEYHQLPPGPRRQAFLKARVDKGRKPSDPPLRPKNEEEREKAEEQWLARWPADRQAQWEEYRKVIQEKKSATRPASAS